MAREEDQIGNFGQCCLHPNANSNDAMRAAVSGSPHASSCRSFIQRNRSISRSSLAQRRRECHCFLRSCLREASRAVEQRLVRETVCPWLACRDDLNRFRCAWLKKLSTRIAIFITQTTGRFTLGAGGFRSTSTAGFDFGFVAKLLVVEIGDGWPALRVDAGQ